MSEFIWIHNEFGRKLFECSIQARKLNAFRFDTVMCTDMKPGLIEPFPEKTRVNCSNETHCPAVGYVGINHKEMKQIKETNWFP